MLNAASYACHPGTARFPMQRSFNAAEACNCTERIYHGDLSGLLCCFVTNACSACVLCCFEAWTRALHWIDGGRLSCLILISMSISVMHRRHAVTLLKKKITLPITSSHSVSLYAANPGASLDFVLGICAAVRLPAVHRIRARVRYLLSTYCRTRWNPSLCFGFTLIGSPHDMFLGRLGQVIRVWSYLTGQLKVYDENLIN